MISNNGYLKLLFNSKPTVKSDKLDISVPDAGVECGEHLKRNFWYFCDHKAGT